MAASIKLGSSTTALEAISGYDLRGKQAVVTGGNSGIGVETVRALCYAGCDVALCCRKVEAGEKVAAEIEQDFVATESSNAMGKISVYQLDLSDLESVKECAKSIEGSVETLHLLILNAGVMAPPLTRTKQGFELQIGVNHIGHAYLTKLLLRKMKDTCSASVEGRIVSVSSLAHTFGKIDLNDLNYIKRRYSGWGAYGQSKLANVLFAKKLALMMAEEGVNIKVYSLHPGAIETNLQQYTGYLKFFFIFFFWMLKSIPQGAATTIVACTRDLPSGCYLSDCVETEPSKDGQDLDLAKKLWDLTESLIEEHVK